MINMSDVSLDHLGNNMELEKDDSAAEKMKINNKKNLDMTIDMAMGKAITEFLGKSKIDAEKLTEQSFEPKKAQIMHIRSYKKNSAICKKLKSKMRRMIDENASSSEEKIHLYNDVINYIDIEKRRNSYRRIVTLDHRLGELKKVWGNGNYEKALESPSNEDVFDMSSLSESLPFNPDIRDVKMKKAKKLAKEYLAFKEKKLRSFRKSEILRILASKVPEENKNSSSKQTKSLTRMVKKVCGDVKNIHIFSFRPLVKKNSSEDNKKVTCLDLQEVLGNYKDEKTKDFEGNRLQNGPSQSEKVYYRLGREIIVLLESPCLNADKKRNKKLKYDSSTANNLRNPERLLFNRNQRVDEQQRSAALRTQQVHDNLSLIRQLSRLKISNSRRGDVSEDLVESEVQEASADLNKGKQQKVAIANRRREVVEKLRESYRRHRQQETEALRN